MPTYGTTAKYALRKLLGSNLISDIDAGFAALADDIDSKMAGYSEGSFASRPTSTSGSPGIAGRTYRATDTGQLFIDTGTGWEALTRYSEGTFALRPTAGATGRIYKATDTGMYYIDAGTGWRPLAGDVGYAEVLTAQTTTLGTATDLTTVGPSVTLSVPTDGLVAIYARVTNGPTSASPGVVFLYEDAVNMAQILATPLNTAPNWTVPGNSNGSNSIALGGWLIFPTAAGTHTYKLRYASQSGGTVAAFKDRKLWARVVTF